MTTKPEGYDLSQTVDELLRFGSEQLRSISRFRLVGYGLLLLALFDFIYMFVPSNFGNPAWEFQTLGLLVERVPVPLLGLALIFFGENYERRRWEGIFLKLLSWLTLAIAIFFLVLVPVGITRTLQLNTQNNTQIAAQANQQAQQLQQVETQLQTGTKEDIQTVALQLNSLGIQVDTQNPDKLKSDLLSRIAEAKQQLPINQAKAKSDQFLLLLKDAAKWNLGALISSLLFARIWQTTRWARRGNR